MTAAPTSSQQVDVLSWTCDQHVLMQQRARSGDFDQTEEMEVLKEDCNIRSRHPVLNSPSRT